MTRSRLYRVTGLVLGRRDYGEADRVLIVLTPEGRLDLLAKGMRKPRSRKAGHLELFSRSELLVARVKGSWDIVSQAEAEAVRTGLQEDFERGTYARYVAELALRFFGEEGEETLFNLVDTTFDLLEESDEPERVVRWYEQRLLILAGFRPEWHRCVGEREGQPCRRVLQPRPSDKRPYGIDLERGGALCAECLAERRAETGASPLSPSALSWLQAFQRRDLVELEDLKLPDRTAQELRRVMDRYISYHLERRPSALRLLKEQRNH